MNCCSSYFLAEPGSVNGSDITVSPLESERGKVLCLSQEVNATDRPQLKTAPEEFFEWEIVLALTCTYTVVMSWLVTSSLFVSLWWRHETWCLVFGALSNRGLYKGVTRQHNITETWKVLCWKENEFPSFCDKLSCLQDENIYARAAALYFPEISLIRVNYIFHRNSKLFFSLSQYSASLLAGVRVSTFLRRRYFLQFLFVVMFFSCQWAWVGLAPLLCDISPAWCRPTTRVSPQSFRIE